MMDMLSPSDMFAVFVYGWLGGIAAQGALHAVWCVFAPVNSPKRFAVAAVAALLWSGAWAVGFFAVVHHHVYIDDEIWRIALAVVLCLPLIVIAIQAPLWLARIWFRWRVRHDRAGSDEDSTAPLRIRHIMIGTAVVGLALGLVRVAQTIMGDSGLLIGVVVGASWALLSSVLIILPVLIATLKVRQLWLSLPTIGLLGYGFYRGLMIGGTMLLGNPATEDAFGVAVTVGSLHVCLAGVLLVFRALGYRLRWERPKTVNADQPTQ